MRRGARHALPRGQDRDANLSQQSTATAAERGQRGQRGHQSTRTSLRGEDERRRLSERRPIPNVSPGWKRRSGRERGTEREREGQRERQRETDIERERETEREGEREREYRAECVYGSEEEGQGSELTRRRRPVRLHRLAPPCTALHRAEHCVHFTCVRSRQLDSSPSPSPCCYSFKLRRK